MSSGKTITVLGATGSQGGSVAKYLLEDGTFSVRAVTRNVDSPAAKALKTAGAEVVSADLENIQALEKAFEGVYGVFGLTDFWTLFPTHNYSQKDTQLHEEQHGRNIVDAAIAANVKHFVWSTLDRTPPVYCFHWESKATIDDYLKSKPLPRTSLFTSFYFENLIKFGLLNKDEASGGFVMSLGVTDDTRIPSYSVDETGAWVLEAFKNPKEWIGKDMHALSDNPTPAEYADALRLISGRKPIIVPKVSREDFESQAFKEQVGDEMWLNNKIFVDRLCTRDMENARKGNPNGSTVRQFMQKSDMLKTFVA